MKTSIRRIATEFISEAKSSPRMLEDLAAMEKYMAESYDGRTFVEILQNADDAGSKRVIAFGAGSDFVVANDGRPFNDSDIQAICRSGASSKQRGSGIGYRGIGFKSATSISTEIVIYSAGTYFTFSKSKCARELNKLPESVPTVRIPFLIQEKDINSTLKQNIDEYSKQGFTTFFIFREGNIEKFCSELQGVDNGWLIFLNSIEQINIDLGYIKNQFKISRKKVSGNKRLITFIDSKEQWLTTTDGEGVSLAFRYDHGIVPCSPDEALFHCYLPTLDSLGYAFKVNADFSTDPSRKHIILKDDISQKKLQQVVRLLVKFIKDNMCDVNYSAVLDLLTSRVGLSEAAQNFEKALLLRLSAESWVPLATGHTVKPAQVRIAPSWIDKKSQSQIIDSIPLLAKYELSTCITKTSEKVDSLLIKLGAKHYGLEEYLAVLKSVDAVSKLSDQLLGVLWAYSFRLAFYMPDKLVLCYIVDSNSKLYQASNTIGSIIISRGFTKGITSVLNEEEVSRLITAFPVFASFSVKEEKKKTIVAVDKGKNLDSKVILSKWKTPVQNCIAFENLSGYSTKDVSKKELGYDVMSFDSSGNPRYIVVKTVKTLGDSFVLSESEYGEAMRLKEDYYVFLVCKDSPEKNHMIIQMPSALEYEKRVKEWEWICSEYDIPDDTSDNEELFIDAKFVKEFSLSYLNQVQLDFLQMICNGVNLDDYCKSKGTKMSVLVTQINSIADFYVGEDLLVMNNGRPQIKDVFWGSIKYLLQNITK